MSIQLTRSSYRPQKRRGLIADLIDKRSDEPMRDDPLELPDGDEFDPDSPAAAMARLRDRLRAIHPQVSVIITGHVALELEVDQVLRRFLSRPDKLPRLSMEQRLGLLRAMLDGQ